MTGEAPTSLTPTAADVVYCPFPCIGIHFLFVVDDVRFRTNGCHPCLQYILYQGREDELTGGLESKSRAGTHQVVAHSLLLLSVLLHQGS
jgi:hypothetical protein